MRAEGIVFSRYTTNSNVCSTGAPNDNLRKNICSEDDLRSRILGTFVLKLLACLPLLGFSLPHRMDLRAIQSPYFLFIQSCFQWFIVCSYSLFILHLLWRSKQWIIRDLFGALLAIQTHHLVTNSEMSHNFLFRSFYYIQDLIIEVNFWASENTLYLFASSIQLH